MNSFNMFAVYGRPVRSTVQPQETKTGKTYTRFTLACDESYTNRNGQRVEKISHFRVVVWGEPGRELKRMVAAADIVLIVVGRLEQRSWLDKHGNNKTVVEVIAEKIGVSMMDAPTERDTAAEAPFTDEPA